MGYELDTVLQALGSVTKADDMLWVTQYVRDREGKSAHMYGFKGHYTGYELSPALRHLRGLAQPLSKEDVHSLGIVAGLLLDLLRPKPSQAVGTVDLKTIMRFYPDIDFETGLPVIDENGAPVGLTIGYTYCYIRQYAAHGDQDRGTSRQLSIYADRGMGKGGTGGYVAAAKLAGLIDDSAILNCWHEGRETYKTMCIDRCVEMLREESGEEVGEEPDNP